MAEPVNPLIRAMAVCAAGCGLLLASLAHAQELPDPTRPPASLNPAAAGGAAATSTPVLQSVKISPRRKSAIISGREVKLNEKFGNARVVRITETEVVLRNGRNVQKLKLFPDVDVHKTKARRTNGNG